LLLSNDAGKKQNFHWLENKFRLQTVAVTGGHLPDIYSSKPGSGCQRVRAATSGILHHGTTKIDPAMTLRNESRER